MLLAAFKLALSKLTGDKANPLVVIIDELDRCRPDFAVRTLERIKHLFEVENVIFVLMLNRVQLCASIRGCYGADVDADGYLRKFLLFSLQLPQHTLHHGFNRTYCRQAVREFGFPETTNHHDFADLFGNLATAFGLQFRDVERGVAMYALAQPVNSSAGIVAWFIAIKLWSPELLAGLLNGDLSAHSQVADAVAAMKLDKNELWILEPMLEIHKAMATNFQPPPSNDVLKWVGGIFTHSSPQRALALVLAKLDMSVA